MTNYLACRPSLALFLHRPPASAVAAFRPATARCAPGVPVATTTSISLSAFTYATVLLADNHHASEVTSTIDKVDLLSSSSPTTTSFEATLPDPTLLVGMGFVALLCIAASFVWANEVVPVSRTKLAISKNRGGERTNSHYE